jgi:hypothetical protein
MIVNGLSWWQAWLCVWFGYSMTGLFVALNGRLGAMYHVGFPVANRASFGIWGSLWPVFNRAAMGKNSPCPSKTPINGSQRVFGMVFKLTLAATVFIL